MPARKVHWTPGEVVPELIQFSAESTGAGLGIILTERAYVIRTEIIPVADGTVLQERFDRMHESRQLVTETLRLLQSNPLTDTLPETRGSLGGQIRRRCRHAVHCEIEL
jgi:hypothetical protein